MLKLPTLALYFSILAAQSIRSNIAQYIKRPEFSGVLCALIRYGLQFRHRRSLPRNLRATRNGTDAELFGGRPATGTKAPALPMTPSRRVTFPPELRTPFANSSCPKTKHDREFKDISITHNLCHKLESLRDIYLFEMI